MENVKKGLTIVSTLIGLAVLLYVGNILLGNLDGNSGFKAGTDGAANSERIINNFTSGQATIAGSAGTWYTITGVVILIGIIAVLVDLFVPGGLKGLIGMGGGKMGSRY